MRLHGLILSFTLAPILTTGCIVTMDMEDDETTGNGSGSSSTTSPATDSGAVSTASGGTASDGTASDGVGDDDTTSDGTSTSTTTDPTEGSSSSDGTGTTGGIDDQTLCESTGGTWDMNTCDHYGCGLPNDCQAVIPGCDCGTTMNFVDGMGCVEDPRCLEVMFACGPRQTCSVATEYCEVFHPGVPPGGPWYSCAPLPNLCIGDATCMCVELLGIPGPEGECTPLPGGGLEIEIFGA